MQAIIHIKSVKLNSRRFEASIRGRCRQQRCHVLVKAEKFDLDALVDVPDISEDLADFQARLGAEFDVRSSQSLSSSSM